MPIPFIQRRDDLAAAVDQVGFVPFFTNGVPGWSVEEHIDPAVWFTDREGPWEWKGPLAAEKACVYGKFIRGKTAFVRQDMFADLAQYRRDGWDWETRLEEGLLPRADRLILEYLARSGPTQARYVRRDLGMDKGFDTALTRLQMQTYVITVDFQYSISRQGVPYGWGNGVIALTDDWLGDEWRAALSGGADVAFERVIAGLLRALPDVDEKALRRALK